MLNARLTTIITGVLLGAMSLATHAALEQADWKNAGDNLITRDTVTGLEWLNLDVTYALSFDDVSLQLASGQPFEGFRYATSAEVEVLWANFGIDLSEGAAGSFPGADPKVETAAGFIGNTWNTYAFWDYPFGVSGITADVSGPGHQGMGAYQTEFGFTTYITRGSVVIDDSLPGIAPYGSYLVVASPVPVPAGVWLFGSALAALVGLGRGNRLRSGRGARTS